LSKVRLRWLKAAFSVYRDAYENELRRDHNKARADNLIASFKTRQLRKYFNTVCAFINLHKRAKKQTKIIIHKVELWELKRLMKRWKENGEWLH